MAIDVTKTNYVHVTYEEENKLMKVAWLDNNTSEEYREVINKSLEFSETHVVDHYLTDIRNQKVVSPEDRKWFTEVAMPRAVKQGLKKACAIFDGNVFKKYYLNTILKTTNTFKLPFKFVNSEEEARDFLLNS
jgi:hypothetical protein